MNESTDTVKTENKILEYVPFGAKDPIKLSVAIVRRLIASPTKTGKLPSDDECIKFLMMCQARKLNPFEGDAFFLGYDTQNGPKFSLITAHQAFLKRAELNAQYDGMKSGVLIKTGDQIHEMEGDFHSETDEVVGGWATVFFKDRAHPMHKRVRLKRFKKNTSIWTEDPAGMICKCAEADALRSAFPTLLGGLYLKEEVESEPTTPRLATPIFKAKAIDIPPGPAVVDLKPEYLAEIKNLCARDEIGEETLREFMNATGLLDEGEIDIATASEESLKTVLDNWEDFSRRMK